MPASRIESNRRRYHEHPQRNRDPGYNRPKPNGEESPRRRKQQSPSIRQGRLLRRWSSLSSADRPSGRCGAHGCCTDSSSATCPAPSCSVQSTMRIGYAPQLPKHHDSARAKKSVTKSRLAGFIRKIMWLHSTAQCRHQTANYYLYQPATSLQLVNLIQKNHYNNQSW